MSMGDELKWLIKEMGECILRVVIFLPHVVSLTSFMYNPVILQCFLSCICLCNKSKWHLPSFVRFSFLHSVALLVLLA